MKRFVPAILLVLAGTQAQAATLTGMVLFQADSAGSVGRDLWNTTPDGAWNVYLRSGGSWLNSGNGTTTSPNFALGPGTTTIQYYAFPADLGEWSGINLFFVNHRLVQPRCGDIRAQSRGSNSGPPISGYGVQHRQVRFVYHVGTDHHAHQCFPGL
jgi:hypothetical protein